MICLLFRDCLLLASTVKTEQVYTVQASITLADTRIEEVDNGKGNILLTPLDSHVALHIFTTENLPLLRSKYSQG